MNYTTIGAIVRGDQEVFPPYLYEAYQSTRRRAPTLPLIDVPLTLSELTGPGAVLSAITPEDADLTRNAGTGGEAIGQRIIVTGHVLDDHGNPIPNTLLEIWQANASYCSTYLENPYSYDSCDHRGGTRCSRLPLRSGRELAQTIQL